VIIASKEAAVLMMNSKAEMNCSASGQDRTGSAQRRLFRALLLSAAALIFCHAVTAAAEEKAMFISSNIEVPIRRGASTKYKIIKIAKVNDQVKLLEEKDDWSRVRFKDGGEGWLPSYMLIDEVPAARRLQSLLLENKQLKQKNDDLSMELTALQEHQNDESEKLAACIAERNTAKAERRAVEDTAKVIWFLAGSGVLFIGWMLGRISGRPRRRRSTLSLR
jgi:SH3 domain protein